MNGLFRLKRRVLLITPRRLLAFLFSLWLLPNIAMGQESVGQQLQLTLPRDVYAVAGVETNIYFDNIVLTKTPEDFQFTVKCDAGQTQKRRWTWTPSNKDVGTHELSVIVSDATGQKLARSSTTLHVSSAKVSLNEELRVLIVGDSLTHATYYPNEIASLLSKSVQPGFRMLGTHRPKSAAKGVAHEGYGGWTWQRFVSKYEPNPDGTHRKRSSPFVYLVDDKPKLDVRQYLQKECNGQQPHVVIFMLGINDCFSAPADDQKGIDSRVDIMFKQADLLLAEFRAAAPEAELGICLTTPPNSRQKAFEANYKDRYTRWGWKRIQHRLVQRQIERFGEKKKEKLFIVPAQLNLDPIDGYPANNGVHPNAIGYKQIGSSIFAWLKFRLDQRR